jgi:pimeloyl-ACP methyl ester carboxylesterase
MASHDKDDVAALVGAMLAGSALKDAGSGRPILMLHGGGGTSTVAALSQTLSAAARVLTPNHPGFDGTPRPAWLSSVAALATFYVALLDRMGIDEIVVVGSSVGGWIGSEMALQAPGRVKGLVLINATGIAVENHPLVDVSQLTLPELMQLAHHDPAKILAASPPPSAQQQAIRVSNAAALAAYDNGMNGQDPNLRARLANVTVPVLVVWGESDGVASVQYGAAYSHAFANAVFERVPQAGHFPHIEQKDSVSAAISGFLQRLGWVS